MKNIIIARLDQITQSLDNTKRVTDDRGAKYIQISDNAARYMAKEIKYVSDYIAKNNGHKQPDK